jgi:hypothetical protein
MSIHLSGVQVNSGNQYEVFVYTAFMTLLLVIPFSPFEFHPGQFVATILQQSQQFTTGSTTSAGSS